MGDIYITTLSSNPATKYLGTTWEKIEGRFLLSTSDNNTSGQVGGSNTVTINKENLPNVKVQVDSFSLSVSSPTHMLIGRNNNVSGSWYTTGLITGGDQGILQQYGKCNNVSNALIIDAPTTGTASPYTSSLGSGTPLDITPAYYTVHIWKRLT